VHRVIGIVAIITLLFTACTPSEKLYTAGTYKGIAEGYHSLLVVAVTTSEYEITEIEIVEEDETPIIAEIVYDEIPSAVIQANSTDVDVVAGATYTSSTLLEAIEDGLRKARVNKNTTSDEKR